MNSSSASKSALERLYRLLSVELGPGVGVAMQDVRGDFDALYPAESTAVAHAIPRRQREFAAGRESVRHAMRLIGWPEMAVPSAADRSPIWPAGLVGSISHSSTACVAMVAPKRIIASIGVDIEDHRQINPDLWEMICTREERAALEKQPEAERGLIVAQLFSAKEAVYKWQYPLTGRMLDFQEVHIELQPDGRHFVARIASPVPSTSSVKVTQGRLAKDSQHIVSWVISRSGS